jgi:mannose-6-phosphate isomerase-like protein (cupin superfamily)
VIHIKGEELEFTPASHEDPKDPGALKKILLGKGALPANGSIMMVNWAKIPAGKSFSLHYHEDMYEVFTFISGTGEMSVGAENAFVSSGDCVLVPPKTPHKLKNTSSLEDIHYIVFGVSYGEGGKTVVLRG